MSNVHSKETLKHEENKERDDEQRHDGDGVDVYPPVKQQKNLDTMDSGNPEVTAVRCGGSTDDDDYDIDAAILTSLAQCCNKDTKRNPSADGSCDALQLQNKCQSKVAVAGVPLAKITRSMSVSEVSTKLRTMNIDESIVQKLADECVDGEALHNFIAEDFEHFGIKYGPMVKIRSLL